MNVLIVSATANEIILFCNWLKNYFKQEYFESDKIGRNIFTSGTLNIHTYVSGIGICSTSYWLTKILQTHKYDLIINVGIAGSFSTTLQLGDVVYVSSDQFADLGVEDRENYLDVFDIGLVDKSKYPFTNGKLLNPLVLTDAKILLPEVIGLTINTTSGSENTINMRFSKYGCDIESMEGAAFHFVCLLENTSFAQVRAISNYITPRDKSKWKIDEAITNLNNWLIDYVKKYIY